MASISEMISEQEDIRRLVEELAKRLDHPQERNGAAQAISALLCSWRR